MAKFIIEETLRDGNAGGQNIWLRLREYLIDGKTVELVRRKTGGVYVIEVRRWIGIRGDRSNTVGAASDTDY